MCGGQAGDRGPGRQSTACQVWVEFISLGKDVISLVEMERLLQELNPASLAHPGGEGQGFTARSFITYKRMEHSHLNVERNPTFGYPSEDVSLLLVHVFSIIKGGSGKHW